MKTRLTNFLAMSIVGTALPFIIYRTVAAAAAEGSDNVRHRLGLQTDSNRLSAAEPTNYTCPSEDQPPIVLEESNIRLYTSSNRELCTLTRTSQSKPGLVPVGRSYNNNDWENVAGPYAGGGSTLVFNCSTGNEGTCDVDLPSVTGDEIFVLTSYHHSRKMKKTDKVARFLEHATFGPTKDEVYDSRWEQPKLEKRFAEWVAEQVNPDVVPPTYHREWWRRRVNPRLTKSWKYGKPGPRPCDATSRWRTFAFSADDVGKHVKLKKKNSPFVVYAVYVDGHVRTVIDQRIVLYDSLSIAVDNEYPLEMMVEYEICEIPGEVVGGTLSLHIDGQCLPSRDGNPRVLITEHVFDEVLLVDMSELDVGEVGSGMSLEYIDEDTYGSELFEYASGDELILNIALVDDVCDALPDPWDDSTSNQPVFGRILDENEMSVFVMNDPRLALKENTVENPLSDGGGMQMHQTDGATLCSNVPRTHLNEDTCRVSHSALACGASATPEVSLHVDHDFLLTLHEVTGRYVYAVDGLDVFQAYGIGKVKSPCKPGKVSRWIPVLPSDCGDSSALSNETMAVFGDLLSSDDDDTNNALVRDIIFPDAGVSCGDGDNAIVVGAYVFVHDTGICWRNVHPHHLNVYDFTVWSEEHPGGREAITQFATDGESTLTFPYYFAEHVISRWHGNINKVDYVGRLGDDVRYADLPPDLQRVEVAAAPTNSGPGVVVCGSPGEVGSDPHLGGGFDIRNKHILYSTTSEGNFFRQRKTVWTMLAVQAPDQLRQRMAWALSQILVVAPTTIPDILATETKLIYYDIFTRHAFGNYLDVLREVAFSPLMGEMLSYRSSKSLSYQLKKTGMLGYPDENFAREVMQLFTIGLVRLNRNGTPALDSTTGEVVSVYDNEDILSFARAWTGFRFRNERGNIEDKFDQTANRIDPMQIDALWRDPFPKMDLNGGYIGDGYPPCVDLPPQHFLRMGAKWRILGSNALPEMQKDEEEWAPGAGGSEVKRIVLGQDSELRLKLCNADTSGGECNYVSNVVLDTNLLPCVGVECHVDSVRVVQVAPDVFYEYIRPPCVELPFFNDGKKVQERGGGSPMCADPRRDAASEACCDNELDTTAISRNCEYTGERTTYERANLRCAAIGKTTCDHENFPLRKCEEAEADNDDGSCCAHHQNYFWTSGECSVQVKVNSEGKVAIVHDLIAESDVSYKVNPDTRNYFRVNWENGQYPTVSDDCGGACLVHQGTCLCNTTVSEEAVFSSMESRDEVFSRLHIGSSHPGAFQDSGHSYSKSNFWSTDDVKLYYRGENKFAADSIFQVQRYGVKHFLQNKKSTVRIIGATTQFAFRNPPNFMSLVDPEVRDAYHETEAVLRHYMYHDNTAPFLATRLLQRFGKSNPSPRYVETVAAAFQSGTYQFNPSTRFGSESYGDLASTVAAILLDREATSVVIDADPAHGSLREPLLKVIGFMRSMQYSHDAPLINALLYNLQDKIGQMAYDVETVFSFFLPEYLPPGPLSRASLVSPEAGVLTTDNVVSMLNGFFSMIKYGLTSCHGGFGPNMGGCSGLEVKDYTRSIGHLSYSPPSDCTDDPEAMVDELATLLTAGRLSEKNREIIIQGACSSPNPLVVAQQLIATTAEFHSTSLIRKADRPRIPVQQPSSPGADYKAVVFVMLTGGMDSYNMLVPHSDCGDKDLYDEYTQVRGAIALGQNELLQIDASRTSQQCNVFGIHNELSELQKLYNDEDLIFLTDVGLLVEPATKADWIEKTTTQLFAHNTMQREAYKVDPENHQGETGVLGRMCDVLRTKGFQTGSVSIDGSSLALAGDPYESPPVTVVAKGGVDTFRYPTTNVDMVLESLNNATAENSGMFGETWSSGLHHSLAENEFYGEVLKTNNVNPASGFGSNGLSKKLEMVSRLIKGHSERGTDRDVFYVSLGGFDAHSGVELNLKDNFGAINTAIQAFAAEMKDQGHWDNVTLVTASDFGRTLTPNTGDGTDHAWSGNYFMLGGPVDGGKILGRYPDDLTEEGPQHIGRGRLIPKTPWDAIWNGVGQWFGITQESGLDYVLPNRAKFGKCGVFTEHDLYGNGQDIDDCSENSPEQCQLTTDWLGYGSELNNAAPGPDGSDALSSSDRDRWSYGLYQYLNNACLVAGQQWLVSAKFKLLDDDGSVPYECDPEAGVGNGASCPLFWIFSEPVDEEILEYSAFIENDAQPKKWTADSWNEFHAVLTVNEDMESGAWTKLFLVGPKPYVTILMGDLTIVPY